MSAYFGAFLTRPLWCALTFVGAVFFAVRVVEPLQKVRPLDESRRLAEAIPERVRTFIALGVLTAAIRTSIKGTMAPCRFRHPHRVAAARKAASVLLAEGMFSL
jgi:hypothetical protein